VPRSSGSCAADCRLLIGAVAAEMARWSRWPRMPRVGHWGSRTGLRRTRGIAVVPAVGRLLPVVCPCGVVSPTAMSAAAVSNGEGNSRHVAWPRVRRLLIGRWSPGRCFGLRGHARRAWVIGIKNGPTSDARNRGCSRRRPAFAGCLPVRRGEPNRHERRGGNKRQRQQPAWGCRKHGVTRSLVAR